MWANNFTLLDIHCYSNEYPLVKAICARNNELQWPKVHAMIVDIVIALAPRRLPVYCLLWIIDWLPWIERAHAEIKKVRLIESVMRSVQKTQAFLSDNRRREQGLRLKESNEAFH